MNIAFISICFNDVFAWDMPTNATLNITGNHLRKVHVIRSVFFFVGLVVSKPFVSMTRAHIDELEHNFISVAVSNLSPPNKKLSAE